MRISDWSSDVCSSDLRQALLAVEPEHLLVVRLQALACQQDAQPPVTEPAPLAGQLAQAGPQDIVASHTLGVLQGRPVQPGQAAGPTPTQAVARHHMAHGPAFHVGHQKFFVARSFSAALSSRLSARRRFSFAFSASSVRSRCASDTVMPPNRALYL